MAQRVVEQDAQDARHGAGSPRPQHGPGGAATSSSTLALAGAQLELGRHRAAELAELDGLAAQRDAGVERG